MGPTHGMLALVVSIKENLRVTRDRRESLAEVADAVPSSGAMPAGVRWAAHPVFASPTRIAMNLDASRTAAAQPAPSYPDVCFAADNFEDGIDEMVLEDPDECYAVMLEARAGLAFTVLEAPVPEPQARCVAPSGASYACSVLRISPVQCCVYCRSVNTSTPMRKAVTEAAAMTSDMMRQQGPAALHAHPLAITLKSQ